jgi:hypothetical protein
MNPVHDDIRPSPEVLSAHLEGEAVLLDVNRRRYFQLNETAAFLWRELERGAHDDGLEQRLVEAFQVDVREAREAVRMVLARFRDEGLVAGPEGPAPGTAKR